MFPASLARDDNHYFGGNSCEEPGSIFCGLLTMSFRINEFSATSVRRLMNSPQPAPPLSSRLKPFKINSKGNEVGLLPKTTDIIHQ